MCAGCVQSGLEFMTAGSVVFTTGARCAGRRVLDRLGLSAQPPEVRRARREAATAAFLEGLDLDPAAVLGWPVVPDHADAAARPEAEELQPV